MAHTIEQIARSLGLRAEGDTAIVVRGVAEPAEAAPDQLALAMKPAFAAMLPQGRAQAAMLWDGADWRALGLKAAILSPRPRYAMAGLSALVDPGQGYAPGIHPMAQIDPSASLGADVTVGAFAVIGPGARIGDRSLDLARREFTLLGLLIKHRGQVLSKERLIEGVYAFDDTVVGANAIELYVARLRKRLAGSGAEIQTLRGRGYRLDAATVAAGADD